MVVFPSTQSNSFKASLKLCAINPISSRLSSHIAFFKCLTDLASAACCRFDDKKRESFEFVFSFKSASVRDRSLFRPVLFFAEMIKQSGFFFCSSVISLFVIRSDLL